MIELSKISVHHVHWSEARRVIRSAFPPIDLFEDIADPADWPLLIAAEQKTNPRLMETVGNIDLVPAHRRVGGAGASYLMAPFTHVSTNRSSRFTEGTFGVLYVGREFETALFETMHHHANFMRRTNEPEGWTSQFRELVMNVDAKLHDLTAAGSQFEEVLDPASHVQSQLIGKALRESGSDGVVYPSQRHVRGQCVGLFYPDLANSPVQGRHLSYHWDGDRVDIYKNLNSGQVFRV